jgi:hypothetical protein
MATYTNQQISDYIAQSGLTGNYQEIANQAAAAGISAEQMAQVLGFTPQQVYEYASNVGSPLQASNQTVESVVTDAYLNQYGRLPTNAELQGGIQFLGGGGTVAGGTGNLSKTTEGYNYDVQDITSAFRQVYGRNPTQEEFVTTAAGLGLDRVNRNVLQFDNYQDALVNEFLQNELRTNPNNPDAAYQNTIRNALSQGITVDQLSRSTGFGVDQIQNYASANQLGNLQTYEALRAANPFRTSATVAALESDPYGGRFATVNPYTSEGINLSQTRAGDFIQYTSPITQQPLTVRFENGQLTVREGENVIVGDNATQTIARSFAAGTLTQPEYDQMVRDLRGARSMTEVYDAFAKPQAQVVLDPTYGFQTGQGKTLAEAQQNAVPIQNLLNQVNLGVMPGVSVIQELARAQGVPYVYTPEMFGMQANERGGFDYSATPRFSTLATEQNRVTPENFSQNLSNLVNQITQQFGQPMDIYTPLSGGYYSERGFEPSFTPIGTAPTFRSGVAGYVPRAELPQGFQFGVNQVIAPAPTFEPGPFNPVYTTGTGPSPADIAGQPIIGYTAAGQPIYGNPAQVDTGGGG